LLQGQSLDRQPDIALPEALHGNGYIHPQGGIGGILPGLLQHFLAERAQIDASYTCAKKRGQSQKRSFSIAILGERSSHCYFCACLFIYVEATPSAVVLRYPVSLEYIRAIAVSPRVIHRGTFNAVNRGEESVLKEALHAGL
jgi:hypothetical protein